MAVAPPLGQLLALLRWHVETQLRTPAQRASAALARGLFPLSFAGVDLSVHAGRQRTRLMILLTGHEPVRTPEREVDARCSLEDGRLV